MKRIIAILFLVILFFILGNVPVDHAIQSTAAQSGRTPTVLDYATLSQLVYFSEDNQPAPPDGWYFLRDSNRNVTYEQAVANHADDTLGYYGFAYGNGSSYETSTHIIVAHRGSTFKPFIDNLLLALSDADTLLYDLAITQDYVSDLQLAFGGIPITYNRLTDALGLGAYSFSNFIIGEVERLNPNAELSFTGHSLGAALAELSAADFSTASAIYDAVTFDSPGTYYPITNSRPLGLGIDLHSGYFPEITEYLGPPNLVNTAQAHIGNMVLLFPDYAQIVAASQNYGDYTGTAHSIGAMVERIAAWDTNPNLLPIDDVEAVWPQGALSDYAGYRAGEFFPGGSVNIAPFGSLYRVEVSALRQFYAGRPTFIYINIVDDGLPAGSLCLAISAQSTTSDIDLNFSQVVSTAPTRVQIPVEVPAQIRQDMVIDVMVTSCNQATFLALGTVTLLRSGTPLITSDTSPAITIDVTGTVTPTELNVRQSPNREASILGTVDYNDVLLILNRLPDNSWYLVQTPDGTLGWVSGAYVDVDDQLLELVLVSDVPVVQQQQPSTNEEVTTVDDPNLGTGDVQVTLRWSGDADLDLHVIEPSGDRIYYGDSRSSTGGQLDVDIIPCNTNSDSRVENIFWPSGASPAGTYQVEVYYLGTCYDQGTISYELTINVSGQAAQYYANTITVGEAHQVALFATSGGGSSSTGVSSGTNGSACTVQAYRGFAAAYALMPTPDVLGCPDSDGFDTIIAYQPFENGLMLWIEAFGYGGDSYILVLQDNGAYSFHLDTYVEGVDQASAGLQPPAGLFEPVRGFGKVWRDFASDSLGWATAAELGDAGAIQRFDTGGIMIYSQASGRVYVFGADGQWQAYSVAWN